MRGNSDRWRIATAPVNFGVRDRGDTFIGAEEYARLAVDLGYEGTDLGPAGFLGAALGNALAVAGGRHDLPFGRHEGFEAGLKALDATAGLLRRLNRFPDFSPAAPKPALACPPSSPLTASGWDLLVRQVFRASAGCRANGLEPVFHHHLGTSVETPEEIDRLLRLTDIGLCLDTGQLLAAGGDPIAVVNHWRGRVRHVHVKDTRPDGAFCRLGDGRLKLPELVEALRGVGYRGWLVVEQDAPATGRDLRQIVSDLRHNRAALAKLGL